MLICFGSPLIDIIAKVENNFLRKYQIPTDQAIRAESHHYRLFQEILLSQHKYLPGGSVTNTARVVKWISKEQYIIFIGTIGNDVYGNTIKEKLRNEQIDCYLVTTDEEETGKCAVLVSDDAKHRSLVTDLGASKFFSINELQCNQLKEKMELSRFLYISTFFLSISIEATRRIIDYFIDANKKIIVNLGAVFIVKKYQDSVMYLYRNADVIVGNEEELLSFAAVNNINIDRNLEKVIKETDNIITKANSGYLLLVTRKSKPILVYQHKAFQYFDVEPVKQIVDTNGAGDAFIGGFLAKYIKNEPIEDCIKCGIWCARNIIQCVGCDFDYQLSYER